MHTLLVDVLSVLGAVSLFLVVTSVCYSRGDRQVTKPTDRQWSIRFFARSALVTTATVLSLVFMATVLADPPGQKLPIADEYRMSVGVTDEDARFYSVQRSIQVIATWLSAEFGMPEFDQY